MKKPSDHYKKILKKMKDVKEIKCKVEECENTLWVNTSGKPGRRLNFGIKKKGTKCCCRECSQINSRRNRVICAEKWRKKK